MDRWRGKWALVTGASAGIGLEFAKQLAAGGANLVLTARRRDRLEKIEQELASKHGITVEIVAADLAAADAPRQIFQFTHDRRIEIELLVNNAGFGVYGEFGGSDIASELDMVLVNCSAVVHLTHLYLPSMIARRHGDILIVASIAGFQGIPFFSIYAATKGFDLLFAEGLAEEVRPHGVHVCALCPGSTDSEFHAVAGTPQRSFRSQETSEKVARVGLQAVAKGKSYVISGAKNYLLTHIQRLTPRSLVTKIAAKLYQPETNRK
ncbi:MAG: SDR family oxidoreductase [Candidatus Acidiferrales bacterium]